MPSSHSTVGGMFSKGHVKTSYRTDSPGVGAYDVKEPTSQRSVIFERVRFGRHKTSLQSPSPGQYSIEQQRSSRGVRIVAAKRNWSYIQSSDNPGPGSYTIDNNQEKMRRTAAT